MRAGPVLLITWSLLVIGSTTAQEWEDEDVNDVVHEWNSPDGKGKGKTTNWSRTVPGGFETGYRWEWREPNKNAQGQFLNFTTPSGFRSVNVYNWTTASQEVAQLQQQTWQTPSDRGAGFSWSVFSSAGNYTSWNWTRVGKDGGRSTGGGWESRLENGSEASVTWSLYKNLENFSDEGQSEDKSYQEIVKNIEMKVATFNLKKAQSSVSEVNGWTWSDLGGVNSIRRSAPGESDWTLATRFSRMGIAITLNWNEPGDQGSMLDNSWLEPGGSSVNVKSWNWNGLAESFSIFIWKKDRPASEILERKRRDLVVENSRKKRQVQAPPGGQSEPQKPSLWKMFLETLEGNSTWEDGQGLPSEGFKSWDWEENGFKGNSWSWPTKDGTWHSWDWKMVQNPGVTGGGYVFRGKDGNSTGVTWKKDKNGIQWSTPSGSGMKIGSGPGGSWSISTNDNAWGFNRGQDGKWDISVANFSVNSDFFGSGNQQGQDQPQGQDWSFVPQEKMMRRRRAVGGGEQGFMMAEDYSEALGGIARPSLVNIESTLHPAVISHLEKKKRSLAQKSEDWSFAQAGLYNGDIEGVQSEQDELMTKKEYQPDFEQRKKRAEMSLPNLWTGEA